MKPTKSDDRRPRRKGPRGKSQGGPGKSQGAQEGRPRSQSGRGSSRPEDTFQEARYLKHLTEEQVPVAITTWEGDEFVGRVEYYDRAFLRLTRDNAANVFVFKKDIKYLREEA